MKMFNLSAIINLPFIKRLSEFQIFITEKFSYLKNLILVKNTDLIEVKMKTELVISFNCLHR